MTQLSGEMERAGRGVGVRVLLGRAGEPGRWQAGPKRWVGDSLGQGSECWAARVWVGPRGKAFWAGQGKDEEAGLGC